MNNQISINFNNVLHNALVNKYEYPELKRFTEMYDGAMNDTVTLKESQSLVFSAFILDSHDINSALYIANKNVRLESDVVTTDFDGVTFTKDEFTQFADIKELTDIQCSDFCKEHGEVFIPYKRLSEVIPKLAKRKLKSNKLEANFTNAFNAMKLSKRYKFVKLDMAFLTSTDFFEDIKRIIVKISSIKDINIRNMLMGCYTLLVKRCKTDEDFKSIAKFGELFFME